MSKSHIVGVYDSEESLVSAIKELKTKDLKFEEVYTPFPIHEVFHLLERKSRFGFVAFVIGFMGAIGIMSYMYFTAHIDWPMNFGGKPSASWPSFIVVTIVVTILVTTLGSLFVFSVRSRIFPGKKMKMYDARATDDKFVVVLNKADQSVDPGQIEGMLTEHGASEVYESN